jgi:hypothetical protein
MMEPHLQHAIGALEGDMAKSVAIVSERHFMFLRSAVCRSWISH